MACLAWLGLACPWRRQQPFRQRRRQQLPPQQEQPQAPPSAARGRFAPPLWLLLLRRQLLPTTPRASQAKPSQASQARPSQPSQARPAQQTLPKEGYRESGDMGHISPAFPRRGALDPCPLVGCTPLWGPDLGRPSHVGPQRPKWSSPTLIPAWGLRPNPWSLAWADGLWVSQ